MIFPVIREPVALRPGASRAEGIFSLAARRISESIGRAGPKLADAVSDAAQSVPALTEFAAQSGLTLEQLGLKSGLLLGVIFPVILLIGTAFVQEPRYARKD